MCLCVSAEHILPVEVGGNGESRGLGGDACPAGTSVAMQKYCRKVGQGERRWEQPSKPITQYWRLLPCQEGGGALQGPGRVAAMSLHSEGTLRELVTLFCVVVTGLFSAPRAVLRKTLRV